MKNRFSITIVAVIGVLAVGLWFFQHKSGQAPIKITMSSKPFPMVLGDSTMLIRVDDADGNPVDADVSVTANMLMDGMLMDGMLPVVPQKIIYENDVYQVPVQWSMAGEWLIDVTAKLPNAPDVVTEKFGAYIYSTNRDDAQGPTIYRSVDEQRNLDTDPAHQMVIVIPQGTRILMQLGQAPDIIPTRVHFSLKGVNTLVIKNNDIVDHTIGPYMVRAGETMRQTFTRTAQFQGKCSVNVRSTVTIYVDE